MTITRRKFLRDIGLLTTVATARSGYADHDMRALRQPAISLLDTNALARYVNPLPIPGILPKTGMRASPVHPTSRIPFYHVPMRQFQAKVHRDMPATTLWGYGSTCPGPTLEVRSGQPILVEWANELPQRP